MKTLKHLLLILIAGILSFGYLMGQDARTLVLIDPSDPDSHFTTEYLIPYLDHGLV